MNPYERRDALRVGRVIRAARKLRGLSQAKLSQELQVTQATFSNLEKGNVAVSGSLWFRLSQILGFLPIYAFNEGIVDNPDHLDSPAECGFKIPKKYLKNAHSTIRTAQPFLRYFSQCFGDVELEAFLRERLDVDPDIRYIYNLQISIKFNCDLACELLRRGKITMESLSKMTKMLTEPRTHGELAQIYQGVQDPIQVLRVFLKNKQRYGQNFDYEIIYSSDQRIDIASKPIDFMRYFSYREDEMPNFLNHYRISFLESLSGYGGVAQPLRVTLIPGPTKRKTECVFRIAKH